MSVVIVRDKNATYPNFPFEPNKAYPEYLFNETATEENKVYELVRETFKLHGFDSSNFGTKNWNPLGEIIGLNNVVVIKPNFVEYKENNFYAVTTHGSVVRAIIDYILIALKNTGKIIVADSTQNTTDYNLILTQNRMYDLIEYYKKLGINNIEIRDVRHSAEFSKDPEGYTQVNLGETSLFATWPKREIKRLYGADYDRKETIKAHTNPNHYYELANTFANADVIISIPKLKTHLKVGVTLNLKGMIGMMGNKNLIPHRKVSRKGDSYPIELKRKVKLYLIIDQKLSDIFLVRKREKIYQFLRKFFKIITFTKQKDLSGTQGMSGYNVTA
ncbi:MAG: DUF362 domain-containing protein, partial [Candidatus Thorarchaeota archaeon]